MILDFEQLKPTTLRELDKYVSFCLKKKTSKQKGGSQVGKNYDEGCYQLSKETCVKNKDCMWLDTNECVVKEKTCSICLQSIFNLTQEKGKTVSKQVLDLAAPNNCNHVFCIDCAQRLYKSTKADLSISGNLQG